MNAEYARTYALLYRHHWWWRAREMVLLRELHRRAPSAGWGRILDVGCGDGLFFDRLQTLGDVWGVEADASLVTADGPHRSRIHIGGFDGSFAGAAPFDLILMLDVLEHLPDPVGALRHARNLLSPRGALLVTVPAFRALWTRHDDLNQHLTRYTVASLRQTARDAGLFPASGRYFFHWLYPCKLLVRAMETVRPGPAVPARIPPTWLNRALLTVSDWEETALRRVGLPFGSSLLLWCQHPGRRLRGTEPAASSKAHTR